MANVALLVWPLIAIAIFVARGPVHGLIWAVLIGHLTLPEALLIDLPALPPYNKGVAVSLGCILGVLVTQGRERVPFIRERGPTVIMGILIGAMLFVPLLTTLTNRERLFYGPTTLPAMGMGETIAMIWQTGVFITLFLVARRYLFTEAAHRALLRAIVLSGMVYSVLILFELRMSPQLHTWVYGYFQHSWAQHLRGGFRPIVFLEHGLWVGFLLYMTVIAAFALMRPEKNSPIKLEYLLMGGWLMLVLMVSRNMGAAVLALLFAPAMLFLPRRALVWIGMVVVIFYLSFPAVRQAGLFPVQGVVNLAAKVSEERASSLNYRFENEADYLARAKLKPIAGWGLWARWRIWDENGNENSTADGTWIIYLGERGWIGYLAFFGLLGMPIFYLIKTSRRRNQPLSPATVGMTVIIAGNLIYLIPNNALSPISVLVAGGLAGYVQKRLAADTEQDEENVEDGVLIRKDRKIKYSRFPVKVSADAGPGPGGGTATAQAYRRTF